MSQQSTREPTPVCGIRITCELGHTQILTTPDMTEAEARLFAGLLDGTSPLFVVSPRTQPRSDALFGRCLRCGTWLTGTLVGYEEPTS